MIKNYPGSKGANGAWQQIISQIPKCDRFVEAMCGSAFISRKLQGVIPIVIANDIDRSVIDKIDLTAGTTSNSNGTTYEVEIENTSARSLIDKYDNASGKTVFYFDPPYLMETRSYKGKIYKHDWIDAAHTEFLAMATTVKSNCMISHYPCALYDETLKDWRKIQYNSMTRAGLRVENLYMNYPAPLLLADYRSVGENFTDRQRIKRKINRLISRLNNEEQNERAAILSAVIDHFSYITPSLPADIDKNGEQITQTF